MDAIGRVQEVAFRFAAVRIVERSRLRFACIEAVDPFILIIYGGKERQRGQRIRRKCGCVTKRTVRVLPHPGCKPLRSVIFRKIRPPQLEAAAVRKRLRRLCVQRIRKSIRQPKRSRNPQPAHRVVDVHVVQELRRFRFEHSLLHAKRAQQFFPCFPLRRTCERRHGKIQAHRRHDRILRALHAKPFPRGAHAECAERIPIALCKLLPFPNGASVLLHAAHGSCGRCRDAHRTIHIRMRRAAQEQRRRQKQGQ